MDKTIKTKLLIVEDEPELRECIVNYFRLVDSDYDISSANSGASAFELIKSQRFDIIVSDIKMPNGDGIELLKNVKALIPDMPPPYFVFMSGHAEYSESEVIELGANKFFAKPLQLAQLLQQLQAFKVA